MRSWSTSLRCYFFDEIFENDKPLPMLYSPKIHKVLLKIRYINTSNESFAVQKNVEVKIYLRCFCKGNDKFYERLICKSKKSDL